MTKNKLGIIGPLNLTKTQKGYVPLEDRFKSFPQDSENAPKSDSQFYFNNYANQTLEKATISLLFPIPKWLRRKITKAGIQHQYLGSGQGSLFIMNRCYVVATVNP